MKGSCQPLSLAIIIMMLNFWPALKEEFLRGLKPSFCTDIFLTNAQHRKKKSLTDGFATQISTNTSTLIMPLPHPQPPPLGLCPQLQVAWEMFISETYFRMSSSSWDSVGRSVLLPEMHVDKAVSKQAPTGGNPSLAGVWSQRRGQPLKPTAEGEVEGGGIL